MNESPEILVVDDDPQLCSMLSEMIAIYLPGAHVTSAYNSDQALAILEREPIDLLLTDNVMPGMNGIDMIEQVKEKHPAIHIIMMTAFNPVVLQKRLAALADIPLLRKPFGLAELVGSLEPHW